MKTKYKIKWLNVAEDDLRKLIEFIARDNLANDRKIFERIKIKTFDLDQSPDIG
ncbi:MAG: type II toxin-antitoxin system RelE/ParE family toxin [Dissulfurimicrobium sp.]|uniref:type II toxin-antitoxin system RelE/ParE family toxin n=1 Tax=Dissulfurimicrobium sp. TaxID=2022436 RepID=UPI00404ABD32